MKKLVFFLIFGTIICASCDSTKIYEKHIDIERITWNRFDIKTFDVDIRDISFTYDFYIAIRHHTDIPIPFLNLRFTMYTPSGETRIMEQKIVLKDKEGKLQGNGLGELWDVLHLAREDFQFTEKGICTIEVSSTMSKADLPGILQVGLIVKKN